MSGTLHITAGRAPVSAPSTASESPASPAARPIDTPAGTRADTAGSTAGIRDDGVDAHLDTNGNPRVIERRFVVEESYARYRLDHYRKCKIPRRSRTKLQRIIRTQVQPLRGRTPKPHSIVLPGDEIVIRRAARPEPACPRTFDVLYDDAHALVINKPAGLPVHASAKFYFNTLARVLSERYPGRDVQICHRLDRETSGVLVVARHKVAAARLKGAFAAKTAQKVYLAVVRGQPPWPDLRGGRAAGATDQATSVDDLDRLISEALIDALDGRPFDHRDQENASHGDHIIDMPLGLVDRPGAMIAIRMEVKPGAAPARTRVRVVARRGRCALLRCIPITGRQHQIRAHLAACGHPIVGDKLYAHSDQAFAEYCDRGLTAELLARFKLPRHALHAAAIALPHPVHDQIIRVISKLPDDLRDYLQGEDPDRDPKTPLTARK